MTTAHVTRPHRACPLCGAPMRVYSLDRVSLDERKENSHGRVYLLDRGETVTAKWQCARGHYVEASGDVPHGTIRTEEVTL